MASCCTRTAAIILVALIVLAEANNKEPKRFCGRKLTSTLAAICKGGIRGPAEGKESSSSHRGGISYHCCRKMCSMEYLKTYCIKTSEEYTPTTTTTRIYSITSTLPTPTSTPLSHPVAFAPVTGTPPITSQKRAVIAAVVSPCIMQ